MTDLPREWVEAARVQIGGLPIHYAVLHGSRLFGMAKPGSDVDLSIIYQQPTSAILGLRKPAQYFDVTFEVDSDEGTLKVDLSAYELERYMALMLKANGNMVEALCAPDGFYEASPVGLKLRAIGERCKTKALLPFYRGYAFGQLKRASKQIGTAKGLRYVFRESLLGIHLLRTGEFVFPFEDLVAKTQELLAWESKVLPSLGNNRAEVSSTTIDRAWDEFAYLETELDRAVLGSPLPAKYDPSEKLNRLLLLERLKGWPHA